MRFWNSFVLETFDVSVAAQAGPCIKFSVVTEDKLRNLSQGLSADDRKWFRDKVERKNPGVCYTDPGQNVPIVFFISVTPDTYHGTRVVMTRVPGRTPRPAV